MVSYFCSVAETAVFSLGKWQSQKLIEQSAGLKNRLDRLLGEPHNLLAALALGNTLANAGMVGMGLWLCWYFAWPPWPTMAGILTLMLVGCEVIPKTLAVRAPEVWTVRVAGPLYRFQQLTRPFLKLAQRLNGMATRAVVPASARPMKGMPEEEYQELLEMAYQQGTLAESEKDLILQIISLDRRTVKEVMRARSQMACISDDLTLEEMIAAAHRHKHRRLPMYDEHEDTIVGILNTRTLLLNPQADFADAIELPSFVPDSMNLLQLFKSLQKHQRGLAIVLDEFGGTAGLVTMEDILEEIIGEIRSEGAEEGFVFQKLDEGRWRISGSMRQEDFRREYPALVEVADVETMGGLMVHLLQMVPGAGESIQFHGLRLTALAVDERRIRELKVESIRKGEPVP